MIESFRRDWERYYKKRWNVFAYFKLINSKSLRYIYSGRRAAMAKNRISKIIWGGINKMIGQSLGNEIKFNELGSGLILMHPYGITVNPGAKLGENVTLFKGSTIGSIRSGSKAGVPVLKDRVTVCCNAMVCGGITIGNDVLIAAGAYVNFDVPDNSVVIGNPGVIHHKENASADYL